MLGLVEEHFPFLESNITNIIQNDEPNNLCLQEIPSHVYLTQASAFLLQPIHRKKEAVSCM